MCLAVVSAACSKTIAFGYPRERILKNSGCEPLAIPRQAPYSRRRAMVYQTKPLAEIKFPTFNERAGKRSAQVPMSVRRSLRINCCASDFLDTGAQLPARCAHRIEDRGTVQRSHAQSRTSDGSGGA